MLKLGSANSSRLSTNELLENIINGPDEDDSDDDLSNQASLMMLAKIKKAQKHLGRAALYGSGARSKLPKVRRKKKETKSPFTVLEPDRIPERQYTLSDSVPPGAHSDNYRRVCNLTRKSLNDPESYQYTTTSMTEGLSYASGQPPWYCGYNNNTVPPDSSLVYAASRYGFRGSKGIKQYETKPYQMPLSTMTEHTPKFLDCTFRIDEWVPPILARPYQTVNGLESPKLWPENTEYPSGARLKKPPTSIRYNRETTIASSDNIELPTEVSEYVSRITDLDNTLRDFARMETSNTFLSGPMTAQLTFESNWEDKVREHASKTLQATLGTSFVRHESQHLTDTTDKITYAGNSAFIVHTQTADELKHRMRSGLLSALTPYENQWNQCLLDFKTIKNHIKRDVSMETVINSISTALQGHAIVAGTMTQLDRTGFMDSFRTVSYCGSLTSLQVSLLFNAFDPMKRNMMHIADLISIFTIINNPLDTTLLKLMQIWQVYELYGDANSTMDVSLSALQSCCVNEDEKRAIQLLFKENFRPTCYNLALRGTSKSRENNSNSVSPTSSDQFDGFFRSTDPQSPMPLGELQLRGPNLTRRSISSVSTVRESTPSINGKNINTRSMTANGTRSNGVLKPSKSKILGSFSAYNISDKYLVGPHDFVEILLNCPLLLKLFDEQLSERMCQCYGRDERVPPVKKADAKIAIEDKDYSWILKSKSGSRYNP